MRSGPGGSAARGGGGCSDIGPPGPARPSPRSSHDKYFRYLFSRFRSHVTQVGSTEAALAEAHWTFLTNHGHVLLCLARAPDRRIRELAEDVGITERAVQRILRDLTDGGYLSVEKEGRRNHYVVRDEAPLRHPVVARHTVGELLGALRA
ncbi:MAG: helix-turn-helix transcriptional regulator [bacterium]